MKKKPSLSREDILHIAKLANLALTEKEIVKFQKQLSEVVSYFEKLSLVKTDNIQPISQLTDIVNSVREDKDSKKRTLSQGESLKNAKNAKNGYFKVKSIFSSF